MVLPLLCRKSKALAMSCTTRLASCSLKRCLLWMWAKIDPNWGKTQLSDIRRTKRTEWMTSHTQKRVTIDYTLGTCITGTFRKRRLGACIQLQVSDLLWVFQTPSRTCLPLRRTPPAPECCFKKEKGKLARGNGHLVLTHSQLYFSTMTCEGDFNRIRYRKNWVTQSALLWHD